MSKAVDLEGAFGCPAGVAKMMATNPTPMLRAVLRIGPGRVSWIGGPVPKFRSGVARTYTAWSLDGKRALENDLFRAAGQVAIHPERPR